MRQRHRRRFPKTVQKAELDYAQAKANLDLNQSIVNSRKQLFAEGAIPGRDLDTAQAALVQAQAAYDTAAKHLESMKTSAARLRSSRRRASSHRPKANTRAPKRRSATLRFAAPSTASSPTGRSMPAKPRPPARRCSP